MPCLKEKLKQNKFVITAEIAPPKGTNLDFFLTKARLLKDKVDAVNVTDNQRAMMRLSPLVCSHLLLKEGLEPIYQMTCRDRNRLAIQSDLLGASVLGIKNVLALTGDAIAAGNHPQAKAIFDIDSVHLLETINKLNHGKNFNGKEIEGKTDFFSGAAVNPGSEPADLVLLKFAKKVKASAKFFQTQAVFDVEKFKAFMDAVKKYDVKILTGILLLKSAKMAHFLNENVPGVEVPPKLIAELEKAENPLQKGIEIAAGLINSLKGISHGVHIMCIGMEEKVLDILKLVKD